MTDHLTRVFEPLVRHMNLMPEDAIREAFREALDAFLSQDGLYVERTTRRGGVMTRPRWTADTLITWSGRVLDAPTKTAIMTAITDFVLYLDGRSIRGEVMTRLDRTLVRSAADIVTALTVHGEPVGTVVGIDTLHVYMGDDPPGQHVPAEQVVDTIKRFAGVLAVKVILLDDQHRKALVSWVSEDEIALFYPEAGGYRVVQRSALRKAQCANANEA